MTITRTSREVIRLILIVVIVYLFAIVGLAQLDHPAGSLSLVCQITPTDQEAQEGYFPCGTSRHQAISINVDPHSDMATFLRAKVGSTIRLTIAPSAGDSDAYYTPTR